MIVLVIATLSYMLFTYKLLKPKSEMHTVEFWRSRALATQTLLLEMQRRPYIVLEHEGKNYCCYELEGIDETDS